jgi:hypothetical protein
MLLLERRPLWKAAAVKTIPPQTAKAFSGIHRFSNTSARSFTRNNWFFQNFSKVLVHS